jgi:hypothetical protein
MDGAAWRIWSSASGVSLRSTKVLRAKRVASWGEWEVVAVCMMVPRSNGM